MQPAVHEFLEKQQKPSPSSLALQQGHGAKPVVKNTRQGQGAKPVTEYYNTGSWSKTCQSKIHRVLEQNLSLNTTIQGHGPKPVSEKYNTGSWIKTCQ